MTNIESSRPLWFLNLMPIYVNNNNDYINASSSPTSTLVRWGSEVGVFLCLEIQLNFLQELKLPRNTTEGDHPITTPHLQFSKELIVVCGGVCRFKWCRGNCHNMGIVQATHWPPKRAKNCIKKMTCNVEIWNNDVLLSPLLQGTSNSIMIK